MYDIVRERETRNVEVEERHTKIKEGERVTNRERKIERERERGRGCGDIRWLFIDIKKIDSVKNMRSSTCALFRHLKKNRL